MTKEIKLNVKTRKGKTKNPDCIPAVIYGPNIENQSLEMNKIEFDKVYEQAGESNLIELVIDDKQAVKALVKDLQKNPLKDTFSHVDFYQVDMSKKIVTEIPLNFIGEAKAVKELGGTLVKSLDSVEVECLPGSLVNNIDIDLSVLNTYDDVISLSDVKMPAGMELTSEDKDLVVASVIATREEKEEIKEEAAPEADAKPEEKKEEKK